MTYRLSNARKSKFATEPFIVRPWCWIVACTLGWMGRQRRLRKDDERQVQTSETLVQLAMIRLMVWHLAKSPT